MNRLCCAALLTLVCLMLGTASNSHAAQITSTPAPRDYELLLTLQTLMVASEDCSLPCFWGLQPGQTSLSEFEDFSQTNFHRVRSDIPNTRATPSAVIWRYLFFDLYHDLNGHYEWNGQFTFTDNTLSVIEITVNSPNAWLPENPYWLSELLNDIEPMPEIYTAINTTTGIIALLLVYPDLGIMTQYRFTLRESENIIDSTDDKPLLLCADPQNTEQISLWLQNPEREQSIKSLMPGLENATSSQPNRFYLAVEEMTGLNAETFVREVVRQPDQCIKMLSYHDLLEKGYGY